MRIGVDARALGHPTFGIGRYTRALLDRMIATSSHEWILYADGPLTFDHAAEARVTGRDFARRSGLLGITRSQLGFARRAAADRVDLFWSPRHHLPLPLSRRVPTVLTIHDLTWRICPNTMRASRRLLERVLMPASVSRADRIICVSQSTADDLCAWRSDVAGKVAVVHEGCHRMEVPDDTSGGRYFLFVGTREPRKNLANLIRGFAAALSAGLTDCRLVIAGGVGWGEPVEHVIRAEGIGDHVDVLGHVPDAVLHQRLAGAIALCLPSLYEGFGLPALEAMQYGTPVIGANVGAIPEVVGDGGILVSPHGAREIAGAMLKLAADSELRATLSGQARARAALFSWDAAAVRTLSILEEVALTPRDA